MHSKSKSRNTEANRKSVSAERFIKDLCNNVFNYLDFMSLIGIFATIFILYANIPIAGIELAKSDVTIALIGFLSLILFKTIVQLRKYMESFRLSNFFGISDVSISNKGENDIDFQEYILKNTGLKILSLTGIKFLEALEHETVKEHIKNLNSNQGKIELLIANPYCDAVFIRYCYSEPPENKPTKILIQLQELWRLLCADQALRNRIDVYIYDAYPVISILANNKDIFIQSFCDDMRGIQSPRIKARIDSEFALNYLAHFESVKHKAQTLETWSRKYSQLTKGHIMREYGKRMDKITHSQRELRSTADPNRFSTVVFVDFVDLVFDVDQSYAIRQLSNIIAEDPNKVEDCINICIRDLDNCNDEDDFWRLFEERFPGSRSIDFAPSLLTSILLSQFKLKHNVKYFLGFLKQNFDIIVYCSLPKSIFEILTREHDLTKYFEHDDHTWILFRNQSLNIEKNAEIFLCSLGADYENKLNLGKNNIAGFTPIKNGNVFEAQLKLSKFIPNYQYDSHYLGLFLKDRKGNLIFQRRLMRDYLDNGGKLSVLGGRHGLSARDGEMSVIEEIDQELSINLRGANSIKVVEYGWPEGNNKWTHCKYKLISNVSISSFKINENNKIEIWSRDEVLQNMDLTPEPRMILQRDQEKNPSGCLNSADWIDGF